MLGGHGIASQLKPTPYFCLQIGPIRPLTRATPKRSFPAMLIYKIFRWDECLTLLAAGVTQGAPVDLQDGFIHFSSADQLQETRDRHFADGQNLWLAAASTDSLGADLVWEKSRGGADFPHLYRALHLADILWLRPMEAGSLPDLT